MTKKILFHQDVHELTGVPIATLRYWRNTGIGPKSFKLGARVAYRLEDIEQWLDEQYAADPRTGGGDAA